MKKIVINKKGTSLVEVLIALFILVISGTAITTLLITSMHAASISAEKLVATNLAREGVEGVVNMVNTNWLRFPSNEKCWDVIDDQFTDVGDCTGKIEDDYYILKLYDGPVDSPFKWTLKSVGSGDDEELELELEADNKEAMKKYCLQEFEGPPESREGLLLQDENPISCTKYYRQITVTYPGGEENKSMEVTSKVQWLHSSEPKTVEATTTLYNEIY